MQDLEEILVENPVIAAIRSDAQLENACSGKPKIVFVLYGNLLNIKGICNRLREAGKIIFIHIDMIEGLKGDALGLEYIKKEANPNGIITTKVSNVRHARNLGLIVIQRIFILDSLSLDTGIKNMKDHMPDAIEVLPGIASRIINSIEDRVSLPIIAGGLIKTKKDVLECLSMGAIAVSTSSMNLWDL